MNGIMNIVREFLIILPGLLVALSFHEYAHARVADFLGDDTPYAQGRLSLNPLAHIDWLGFFMLLVMRFGWAKPVQVNPLNFRGVGIRQGMMLVSLAGPAMNFLLAVGAALAMKVIIASSGPTVAAASLALLKPLMVFNIILGVFNLIPVPPLDGSKILAGLLPDEHAAIFYRMEAYGPLILILLIFSGLIGKILWPLVNGISNLLSLFIIY